MAEKGNGGAYGAASSDTSFRRTWNREEYSARAAEREQQAKTEGRARYEAALQGKKYHHRATTPPDAKETEARKARLDVASLVGKTTLVPIAAAVGKRGRGAGFYCDACDLTFKDNLQFIEHLNSRQHLVAVGQTGEVRRATVEEVKDRLAWLKAKQDAEKDIGEIDLDKRIQRAQEVDETEREERRRKRNEKRRKTKDGLGHPRPGVEDDGVIR